MNQPCSDGGNHIEAFERLEEALMIFEEFYDRPNIGNTLDSLGTAYENQGDYATALIHYEQALEILRDVGDRSGVGIVLTNMGDLYEQMGDPQEAIRLYEQAITESIEPIWSDLRGEELQISYADKHVDTYAQLIRLLWEQERYEDAFNYTERARARVFLNQITRGPNDFLENAGSPELNREQSLRAEIEDLNNQILSLSRLPLIDENAESISQLRDDLSAKQTEYETLLNRLRRDNLEAADLVSVSPAELSDIQALLDEETTLVSYFVMDDQTLAFVVTRDGLEPVALAPGKQALENEIQMLYAYDFAALDNPHPARLQQLHEWLIQPLEPYLSTSHVEIAPHNLLHYVPFSALSNGEDYLVDRYTLSQLPSASIKRFLEDKRNPPTNTLMALGNPTFDLVFAGREAETISKLYEAPVLIGAAATESIIRSRASQAEILHLATHGEYNPISPLFSTLRLNPDESNPDGRLYVHEIYGLDLTSSTNLVVLSACQTQVGQLSRGDEIIGLSRAFLYAGTPSVIASLWNIDDEATSLLMEYFYTYLQSGKSKAEALQLAQQETREIHPHPYYWAAFALTGDRR
ncbi:MAG: CHAT domain-containing protein [Elainellaceae cyanobacterium]